MTERKRYFDLQDILEPELAMKFHLELLQDGKACGHRQVQPGVWITYQADSGNPDDYPVDVILYRWLQYRFKALGREDIIDG